MDCSGGFPSIVHLLGLLQNHRRIVTFFRINPRRVRPPPGSPLNLLLTLNLGGMHLEITLSVWCSFPHILTEEIFHLVDQSVCLFQIARVLTCDP
jgi:hypothetical protein